MSTLIDSVKRLERAGSANSKATDKLREAASNLAEWIADRVPTSVELPRGYMVSRLRSGVGSRLFLETPGKPGEYGTSYSEYLNGFGGCLHGDFTCPTPKPSREAVLQFAKDVSEGLLDEITEWLEKRAKEDAEATETLGN